jgi:hypothetical protein
MAPRHFLAHSPPFAVKIPTTKVLGRQRLQRRDRWRKGHRALPSGHFSQTESECTTAWSCSRSFAPPFALLRSACNGGFEISDGRGHGAGFRCPHSAAPVHGLPARWSPGAGWPISRHRERQSAAAHGAECGGAQDRKPVALRRMRRIERPPVGSGALGWKIQGGCALRRKRRARRRPQRTVN